jgi:hypothetical protein
MAIFCSNCGKEAEGAFCSSCGKFLHQEGATAAKKKRPSNLFMVFIGIVFCGLIVYASSGLSSRSTVDRAIDAAADACGTHNKDLLASRIVAAEEAIRDLPIDQQGTYEVKLHNKLKFIMCE